MARLLGVLLLATATVAAAQPKPDEQLELVVALFRHGIRPPLKDPNDPTKYSKEDWPKPADWKAGNWGDLTDHGAQVAKGLGRYFADHYTTRLPKGSEAYLWADVADQHTKETAKALAAGLADGSIPATCMMRDKKPDPLFTRSRHPVERSM